MYYICTKLKIKEGMNKKFRESSKSATLAKWRMMCHAVGCKGRGVRWLLLKETIWHIHIGDDDAVIIGKSSDCLPNKLEELYKSNLKGVGIAINSQ